MKNEISESVNIKVKQLFSEEESEIVISAFENANFPLANNYERIFLAILKLSEGNLEAFQDACSQAEFDWRDVLVWAKMAN